MPRAFRRTPTRAQVRRALDDWQRLFGRKKKTPPGKGGVEAEQDSRDSAQNTTPAEHRAWVDAYDRAEREMIAKGYLR